MKIPIRCSKGFRWYVFAYTLLAIILVIGMVIGLNYQSRVIKMKQECSSCYKKVKKNWRWCPYCGNDNFIKR